MKNTLYYGDNLDILRRYITDESVDLTYLDPPFNSNADYNVLFREHGGAGAAAQIKAFGDTWAWNIDAAAAYEETVEAGGTVSHTLQAFRQMLGDSNMMAYLAMMAPRLQEIHRVLKPTGSLYLHCDPTASSYLRILLDAIFSPRNFRNEIIWKRTTAHSSANKYAPIHDTLLYFVKGEPPIWNFPRTDYTQDYLDKYYKFDDGDKRLYWRADITGAGVRHGDTGEPWRGLDVTSKGRHWAFPREVLDKLDSEGRIYWPPGGSGWPQHKRYREDLKGKPVADIWDDIDRINPVGAERLGYPTQKPEALLDRIIETSSNIGDVVLDPFCGCGTSIAAAQRLGRKWIGIDITHLAVGLIKHRLRDQFGELVASTYQVIGEPVSIPDAARLAGDDPFQFQAWALGLVGARTAQSAKKGSDKGIDGNLYFHDDAKGKTKRIILSVKAGENVSVAMVRDLVGTITRESADIGVLLTMTAPTGPMTKEAASAGFYTSPMGGKHAKVQILTIADLLDGKGIDYPARSQRADVTFRKARKVVTESVTLPFSTVGEPDDAN